MSVLEAAIHQTRHGRRVVPIPFRSKNPGLKGWPSLRLDESDLPKHFNGKEQNLGVLTGEPSGGLIDVDLDHRLAVQRGDRFLPVTPAMFGRASKPRSHRLYRVKSPLSTKQYLTGSGEMIVEIRSTRLQTVFPPSVHESGEQIEWIDPAAEPLEIEAERLVAACDALADDVLVSLGEPPRFAVARPIAPQASSGQDLDERAERCVAALLRMKVNDRKDGSRRLLRAACRCVEHDLDETQSLICIRNYEQAHPFPRRWSDDDILRRLRDAENRCERGKALVTTHSGGTIVDAAASKQGIMLGTDEHRVIDESIAALTADENLYQRGGILVRLVSVKEAKDGIKRPANTPVIKLVPVANLRDRLTRFASFTRLTPKGEVRPAHPVKWLIDAIDARAEWNGIRVLLAIADAPILRADGTIAQQAGYDEATGVLLVPAAAFPAIDDNVDIDDAQAALEVLLDVVADFPFESDAHRAGWLASLLTPLARHAFDGCSPLFLVDANVPGAGKGLLIAVTGIIVSGSPLATNGYAHKSEEMIKKITAIAIAGDRMILLDNIAGPFGNAALDRALTAPRWRDRILCRNEEVELPLYTTWYATGNNVQVGADTVRRVVHIRLNAQHEHPELRSNFRHPDLTKWVTENRPRLYAAALTLLAAYCRAGRPTHGLPPYGGFESWSGLVREAIVWVGMPDPCATRLELAATSDTSTMSLRRLFAAWEQYDHELKPVVLSKLIGALYPRDRSLIPEDEASAEFRAAIEELIGCPPDKTPDARKFGARLKHAKQRIVDGFCLDVDTAQRRDGAMWVLRRLEASHEA